MSSFIVGDEVTRFCPTPDEWDKIAETVTARRGGAGWSDKTGDQIIADLMRMKKKIEKAKWEVPGVTVVAGKAAYATLRNTFPEDIELVKIVECAYLDENECFAIKNVCLRW